MLLAMSRSVVLGLVFGVVVVAPFALTACDGLKKDSADAAVVVPVAPATTAPVATAPTPDPGTAPVAPLGGAVAPTPAAGGVKPAVTADAGKPAVADAAAPADAGKTAPAPTPTPTFTFPTAIPGFDAGGFKPPPGFPSTLPTFPPPPK